MASGISKLILIFKGLQGWLAFCLRKSQRAQESVGQELGPRSGFVRKVAGSPWAGVFTIPSPSCPRRMASRSPSESGRSPRPLRPPTPPTLAHPTWGFSWCHDRPPREAGSLFPKPELGCSLKTQLVSAGRVRPCVLVPSIFGPQRNQSQ